jgi:hypothetical protein
LSYVPVFFIITTTQRQSYVGGTIPLHSICFSIKTKERNFNLLRLQLEAPLIRKGKYTST